MIQIEKYESILEQLRKDGKPYWKVNRDEVNYEVFSAYCDSKARNHDMLDISGSFWGKDIPAMVEAMKAEGVKEFTVSDSRCGIAEILTIFEVNGAKLEGLTQINSGSCDIETGEPEMIPAFLMRLQ